MRDTYPERKTLKSTFGAWCERAVNSPKCRLACGSWYGPSAKAARDLLRMEVRTMAILRRHQHDRSTFEELDKMGQVRSMNGTVQTLVRMTVAHGRRVGLQPAK